MIELTLASVEDAAQEFDGANWVGLGQWIVVLCLVEHSALHDGVVEVIWHGGALDQSRQPWNNR